MKITLPGGQWAVLADPDTITAGQRRKLLSGFDGADKESTWDAVNRATAHLLQEWSFDLPLPTVEDLSSLDEITAKQVDCLYEHLSEIIRELTPNFDPNPDPASPTVPSAGSPAS